MKRNIILKQLGYSSFNDYLNSNHWNLIKQNYKSSGRPLNCYICNSNNTQIHHKTYKNIGKESLDDLVTTCNNCYENIQKFIIKNPSISLALAHIILKRDQITFIPKKNEIVVFCCECKEKICLSKNRFLAEVDVMKKMNREWACKNCRQTVLKIPTVLVRKCGGFYEPILKLKTINKFSIKKNNELVDNIIHEEIKVA